VLTVAYDGAALAQYTVAYAAETRRIAAITDARLIATRHPSPQPLLSGLGAVEWRPVMPLRPYSTAPATASWHPPFRRPACRIRVHHVSVQVSTMSPVYRLTRVVTSAMI